MIPKIVHLDPYFPTGELTVQPVLLWSNGRPCYEGISKHASVGTEYFKSITPVPGHSFVYVLAVSSWETYGENRNGDSFPESPYKEHENPPWISPQDILPLHYKTFEQFGYNYRHHVNKDPAKAVGKVVKAFWNPTMHRVELLVDLENEKAPDLVERIANGEFPPVSMGTRVMYDVCVTPDTLIRTGNGYKSIQDIFVGEKVRTHTGALKTVTKTFQRTAETLVKISPRSVPPITCTENHPFYVWRKNNVRTCQGSVGGERLRHQLHDTTLSCKRCNREVVFSPEWVAAEELHVGDYLLSPVDKCADDNTVGIDSACVLGYYLGDGCTFKAPNTGVVLGAQFSLDTAWDSVVVRLENALDNITEENTPKTYSAGKEKNGVTVVISDQGLATWLKDLGGSGARTKRIAEEVFGWSKEEKKALVGGYINTDGSYDETSGVVRITTVNRGLALDTQRLLHSLQIPASVSYGGHTTNTDFGSDTDYWYVFIPAAYAQEFTAYSDKVKTKKIRWSSSTSFFFSGYWCTPIKSMEILEGTSDVYNLEVDTDESYVAEGIATHNCSICGNRAPTRAQYCDHLKFQMRDVIEGRKVSALNPSPKFFDISWVFRGADPIAFMLKKVAYDSAYELSGAAAGEYLEGMTQTKNAARKMAVIDKIVQGIPVDAKEYGMDPSEVANLCQMRDTVSMIGQRMPTLPDNVLQNLSGHSMPKIFSSLMASGGMMLSTPEVIKITIYKMYPKSNIDNSVVDRSVAMQSSILKLFSDFPQLLEKLRETGILDMGVEHVDPKVAALVAPYMEKRSGISQYLKRQLIPEDWQDVDPYTQQLSITDPATGETYGTTIGAATRAHDEIAKANLKKVVGGAALLGGAYKLIGSGLDYKGFGKLKPLAALGLGALGVSQWPSMGKHYMTDQGVPVPTMTELAKVSSATTLALPLLGTLGAMALMSHDYQSRLRSGIPVGYQGLPWNRRLLDQAEQFSDNHPILAGTVGALTLRRLGKTAPVQLLGHRAKRVWEPVTETLSGAKEHSQRKLKEMVEAEKLSSYVSSAVSPSSSTVLMPDIDLEKVSMWLGDLILNG